MAKVLPRQPIDTSSRAELRMREILARLPAKWRVLHSVSWQSPVRGRPADGEADFVLVHPDYGILVVEVKGGGIRVTDGEWTSRDRDGIIHEIKDPFDQAVKSKYALMRFLSERLGQLRFPIEHAVALPDVDVPPLGPSASPQITWDRQLEQDVEGVIQRTVNHYRMKANLSPRETDDLVTLLLPSIDLQPPLFQRMQESDEQLAELTKAQIRVLDGLRRHRRASVYGSAGTGKTVLAMHKASQLAAQGFEVLLVCFNRPLADHLSRQVEEGHPITVTSFHKLCADESRAAGLPASGDGETWWETVLPNQLAEAASANGTSFDAIVVDEGQDFSADWWVALQMLLRDPDDGGFYVFADAQQAIYRQGWAPPFEGIEFELTTNCRNTIPIARLVAGVFSSETDTLGADGPTPEFTVVNRTGEVKEAVRKLLHRLVNEDRVPADQIALLSPSKDIVEALRARKLGRFQLAELGRGDVTAETIQRFKGLEAAAVVLVVPPGSAIEPRLLYIGMSRARTYLEIVGDEQLRLRLGLD